MSEIADELERMAKELDEAADHTREARGLPKHRDLGQVFAGVMTGYQKSAERLRRRAAELRQQRSGPVYKPQPKPAEVKVWQWWSIYNDGVPHRVMSLWTNERWTYARFTGEGVEPVDCNTDAMLRHREFVYFGDGELPAT
jgi:hypothetical protein